jgi:hypothetical protein
LVYDIDSTLDKDTNINKILEIFAGRAPKPSASKPEKPAVVAAAEDEEDEYEMDEISDEEEEETKEEKIPTTAKTGIQKAFFILGGPASGKGTYCTALNKEHNIPHFSTGDLLRKEIASGSKLADQINDVIK